MPERKYAVGGHIVSQCTKCRAVMNHTIVAMVEDRVVRVLCNTCNGEHNYRPPKADRPKRAAASGSRSPRVSKKQQNAAEEWDGLTRPLLEKGKAPVPYAMDAAFRVDDLVEHPVFGLGVVAALQKPNKMEVVFEAGRKLLRCTL